MPVPSVRVLCPASDTSREELTRLNKVYAFPDFVKKASLDEAMQPPTAAVNNTYADPRFKRYSCHSAAATWLSSLYFLEKQAEFNTKDRARIQQRLESMVDFFRIRGAYDDLLKQAAVLRKEEDLPDSSYAYVWADEAGNKSRYLPMRSAMETKEAGEWLQKYRQQLPFQDRNTVAIKVLEKAAHFGAALGADITEFLEKQAGMGVCEPAKVYTMIMQRAVLASKPAHKEHLVKLAETVKGKPRVALQPEQLVKLAIAMDITDAALGLQDNYNDTIQRPEDVIFEATFTKLASDRSELCALTTGNVYLREQFEKLSYDDVTALFGTDFANEVSVGLKVNGEKMAAVATTLPRPDAELLDTMLNDSGIHPQMQKSASASHGMSNEDLEAMAAMYGVPGR